MKNISIDPIKRLRGDIILPGDKSISHRAVMIGAISEGTTRIRNLLDCDDCNYTLKAFLDMGLDIKRDPDETVISGKGMKGLSSPKKPIYLGDSGTSMRLLAGILAGQDFEVILTGGSSLSKRPMQRIVEPLQMMGVDIKAHDSNFPPITIKGGKPKAIEYGMKIASAQVKSAILFAGLSVDGVTTVVEPIKSRDHTERMLKFFGADVRMDDLAVSLKGISKLTGRSLEVPGDISSAAFFIVAATILPESRIVIKSVGINPTRTGLIDVLLRMGAGIKVENKKDLFEPAGAIVIESSSTKGTTIEPDEIPRLIDEIPILLVLASVSEGITVIKGARELRVKETDRINSMSQNLAKMGANVKVRGDDIVIEGVRTLRRANLTTYNDHRTAMSLTIAAISAKGSSKLDNIDCINKSFPEFLKVLRKISLTK